MQTQKGQKIRTVACVGMGIIGNGWTKTFESAGLAVRKYDTDPAKEHDSVRGAQYVQESVPENLDDKWEALEWIERRVSRDAIIATSTSGLSPTVLQTQMLHPGRFIVAHPFNPPDLIPLVEVVPGEKTSKATVKATMDLMFSLGKAPVLVNKVLPGFVGNRIQAAIFRETLNLLADGVMSAEDLETVFTKGLARRLVVMGQLGLFSLTAGPKGMQGYFDNYGASFHSILETMDCWTVPPGRVKLAAIEGEAHIESLKHGYAKAKEFRDLWLRYNNNKYQPSLDSDQ